MVKSLREHLFQSHLLLSLLLNGFSQLLDVFAALVSLALESVNLLLLLLPGRFVLLLLNRVLASSWLESRDFADVSIPALELLKFVVSSFVEPVLLDYLPPQLNDVLDEFHVHVHDAKVVLVVDGPFHFEALLE